MLDDFLSGTEILHVAASKLSRDIDAAEIGCSVDYLASAWRVALYGENPVDVAAALEPFIGYCQDISLAWIMVEADGSPEKHGHSEELVGIQSVYDSYLSGNTKELMDYLQVKNDSRCLILGTDVASERSVVLLDTGETKLFCLISGAELAAVISAWHQVF